MEKSKHEDYLFVKIETKKYYSCIRCVWCPLLNSYIHFNRAGFRHLIWKKSEQRTKREQLRRFLLLPYASIILSKATSVTSYREKEGVKFWALTVTCDDVQIKLIVRQVGEKQKHFLSIFRDKQKSTQ